MWVHEDDYYPTLQNSLFGAVKLVKNADINKHKYSGYGVGFDRGGTFSVANGFGNNAVIFGVDMSASIHVGNKQKDNLILGKSTTQVLDDTILTAEKKYSISFKSIIRSFI